MKKFLALVLAGTFVLSMTVCAASPNVSAQRVSSAPIREEVVPVEPDDPPKPEAEARAEAYHKSVPEYSANAITETPGLEDAAVVAGGSVVINGAASNATFTLDRVESGTTEYAKSQASAVGGKLLNVVSISAPGVNFRDAKISFYVEGVTAGQNVAVYQCIKGVWTPLTVSEVTNNGVEVTLTSAGILSFVALS